MISEVFRNGYVIDCSRLIAGSIKPSQLIPSHLDVQPEWLTCKSGGAQITDLREWPSD